MKSMLRAVCLFLVFGALVFVGRLGSEPKPPPAPKTRIGLINLGQVFRDYAKVVTFAKEKQELLKPYEEKAKDLKEQIDAHTKTLEQKDLTEESRAQHQKKLKARQRDLEDLTNEYKLEFAKKSEEQMSRFYKDVTETAQRYARANDLDLVMHYNDVPADSPEFYSGANVSRKIQSGTLFPMYSAPGMDITKEIVAALNDNHRKATKEE